MVGSKTLHVGNKVVGNSLGKISSSISEFCVGQLGGNKKNSWPPKSFPGYITDEDVMPGIVVEMQAAKENDLRVDTVLFTFVIPIREVY